MATWTAAGSRRGEEQARRGPPRGAAGGYHVEAGSGRGRQGAGSGVEPSSMIPTAARERALSDF